MASPQVFHAEDEGVGERGLRFGRVPPDDDMRMLRCDPLSTPGLPDATKIALTAWAAKHAKDPRKAVAWDDELQQTSLLRWLESETTNMASPIDALRFSGDVLPSRRLTRSGRAPLQCRPPPDHWVQAYRPGLH